jgi:hypothetical protein
MGLKITRTIVSYLTCIAMVKFQVCCSFYQKVKYKPNKIMGMGKSRSLLKVVEQSQHIKEEKNQLESQKE